MFQIELRFVSKGEFC